MMKKILPILGIFLICIFTICTSTFASTDLTINNVTYTLPEAFNEHQYKMFFIIAEKDEENSLMWFTYAIMSSDSPITVSDYTLSGEFKGYTFTSDTQLYYAKESIYGALSFWDRYYTTDFSSLELVAGSSINVSTNGKEDCVQYYTSHDILDDEGTVVFHGAPPKVVLPQIVEQQKETMRGTLEEIVKILPIVMIILVSLIALRKALQMLSTLLRRS